MYWPLSVFPLLALAFLGNALAELPVHTIVDVLSSTPEFSTLVGLLQNRGLIPLVNRSFNSTFLAPVNSAFAEVDLDTVTRDVLLYHFLNDTLYVADTRADERLLLPTYLLAGTANVAEHAQVMFKDGELNDGESTVVDSDLRASKERGVVQAISEILTVPKSLCDTAFDRDEISIFAQIAHMGATCSNLVTDVTMFAPEDEAFSIFPPVAKQYLFSGFANLDRLRIIRRHIHKGIIDPEDIPQEIEMLDGAVFSLQPNLTIGGVLTPTHEWIVALDGILNTYQGFLGTDIITFTPEKYLLGLGGHNFIREVELYGRGELIDGSFHGPQTILLPLVRDDIDNRGHTATQGLKHATVLYQFLTEQVSTELVQSDIQDRLIDTKFSLASGKFPQRVHFTSRPNGKSSFNWQDIMSPDYVLGNTSIYIVNGEVPIPSSLATAVGPVFLSSYSLSYLDDLNLLTLPIEDSWSLLLPTKEAWEAQSLLKSFFDSNYHSLRILFNSLIFKTPVYSDSVPQNVTLLSGKEAEVQVLMSKGSSRMSFSIDEVTYPVEIADVLFDNGVAHCVTKLNLPADLEISSVELIESGGRGEFVELLRSYDLDYVLKPGSNYTIFVPDPAQLVKHNYTNGSPEMLELLKLHIFEDDVLDRMLQGESMSSLAGDKLEVHRVAAKMFAVGPEGNSGRRAFVSAWAQTNGIDNLGSSVLFIDTYISPKWFSGPTRLMHAHTLLLAGIIIGLMITAILVFCGILAYADDKVIGGSRQETPSDRAIYSDDPDSTQVYEDSQQSRSVPTSHVSEDRERSRLLGLPE